MPRLPLFPRPLPPVLPATVTFSACSSSTLFSFILRSWPRRLLCNSSLESVVTLFDSSIEQTTKLNLRGIEQSIFSTTTVSSILYPWAFIPLVMDRVLAKYSFTLSSSFIPKNSSSLRSACNCAHFTFVDPWYLIFMESQFSFPNSLIDCLKKAVLNLQIFQLRIIYNLDLLLRGSY